MKIAWLTDIHLNFLDTGTRSHFYNRVMKSDADKILITGDIAEAKDVCELLKEFSQHTNKPI
jgi:predicted phosphodiesterase